jgi:hypothetical protein
MPIAPRIHDNGTGRERLIQQFSLARDALEQAFAAMALAAPKPWDYSHDFEYALTEYLARMQQIRTVKQEIEAILSAIGDQP